ncbi:MAG: hypothetical protein KIT84_04920 [Labilithrix sp.]|nr:hypothetical protein [Labilithrix sp.]MCW5810329.1 hypothetical protein [Labilithrix sp.]
MNATEVRRAAPAAVLVLAIAGAAAWVLPAGDRPPLAETLVWSLLVMTAFAGWGGVVAFAVARDERVDLGLRVAWGASLVCSLGGLLMVPALMNRAAALLLVDAGVLLAIAELVRSRARVRSAGRFVLRFARRERRLAVLFAVGALVIAIHYLAGIAEPHTNPYDDDIAYFGFVKKLLATGTVIEPFSFRRLSALGGQTLFVAMVWLRSAAPQANTFDRSICFLLVVLLVLGHRSRGRRLSPLVLVATLALLVTTPFTGINTASWWSGIAFFLALYRTISWAANDEGRAPWKNALPLALVAACVTTLRQNYLPVPVFVFAASYGFRLWHQRTRRALVEPLWTAGLTIACLAPWLVASWQSNRTLLYPIMAGTFNRALALSASDWGFWREVKLNVWTFLEGIPNRAVVFFIVAAAFLREREQRRPLGAYVIGAAGGFFALVHGLNAGDPGNVGRYAVGYVIALVLAVVLAAGTTRPRGSRAQVALGIVLVASAAHVLHEHANLHRYYNRVFEHVEQLANQSRSREAREPPEAGLYGRLQSTVPAGERLAVLLDEPYHLDWRKNPIWNLDMPGYSSPAPGMPFFQGSEKLESYLRGTGVRYLAYVRPDHSRYHYRREYWIGILVDEMEIWRAFAPYLIDFMDSLAAITARHKVLFDDRGLVVVDLEEAR